MRGWHDRLQGPLRRVPARVTRFRLVRRPATASATSAAPKSFRWFCSLVCQGICAQRLGMIDPTRHERAAMDHAVDMAGG